MTWGRKISGAAIAALMLIGSAAEASACARAELIFHLERTGFPHGAVVAEVFIISASGDSAEARVLRPIRNAGGLRRLHLRSIPSTHCSYFPHAGQRGVIVALRRGSEGGIPVVVPSLN
jgi:hypothetical protein